jgi:Tol biopolymer transport system component
VAALVDRAFAQSPPAAKRTSTGTKSESRIVFVSDRDGPDPIGNLGNQEIYIMNPDGTDQRRLTHEKSADAAPNLSPDGSQIAFMSERAGGREIFIMNVDGTNPRQLTHSSKQGLGGIAPAWSPDGKRIAFRTGMPPFVLYVINVDGTGLRKISDRGTAAPAWSPDGQKLVFQSRRTGNTEIFVMDSDGGNVKQLTFNASEDRAPAWSPDGKRIAFDSDRDGESGIYVMNADGSDQHRITSHSGGAEAHPSWSPDGKQITFHKTVLGHGQVHVMNADGSNVRRLTELSPVAFSGYPSWGRAHR